MPTIRDRNGAPGHDPRRLSQRERVLRALRAVGAEGLKSTAFLPLPVVIDHGPAIVNLSARIEELRRAGYSIETRRDRGRKTVRYYLTVERLTGDPTGLSPQPSTSVSVEPLFTAPSAPASPFDPWGDAA